MKKLSLILFLISYFAFRNASAQCAIYYEEETGIWGAQWDNGKPPFATMDQVKDAAKKKCEEFGGKSCKLLYSGWQTGWWVVIRGRAHYNNKDGYLVKVMRYEGQNSLVVQAAAEEAAIKAFINDGGKMSTNSEDVKSWYVPEKQE